MTRPVRWVPREHGAWAILAVPLLLGIAAAGATAAHALLAVTAVSAYLCSVPLVDWARSRRAELLRPVLVYGAIAAISGVLLLAGRPELAILAVAVAGAGLAAIALSLAGRPKSVLVSLIEVAQAVALVPAAAIVAGALGEPATLRATLAASLYLAGSVLLVRSMIRARGNRMVLGVSIGFHAIGVAVSAAFLPWPYAVLAAALLGRAVALPVIQRRLDASARRLRPIHIGMVEIAASLTLVLLGFGAGF